MKKRVNETLFATSCIKNIIFQVTSFMKSKNIIPRPPQNLTPEQAGGIQHSSAPYSPYPVDPSRMVPPPPPHSANVNDINTQFQNQMNISAPSYRY